MLEYFSYISQLRTSTFDLSLISKFVIPYVDRNQRVALFIFTNAGLNITVSCQSRSFGAVAKTDDVTKKTHEITGCVPSFSIYSMKPMSSSELLMITVLHVQETSKLTNRRYTT